MRKLVTNANDTFRVKAYAGTTGVLLAMDIDESSKPDLLGFAIEEKEKGKDWRWLWSSLTFPNTPHTIPRWGATASNIAPFQKFRWGDYSIESGTTCAYRIYPAYRNDGDPGPNNPPRLDTPLEVEVTTDDGKPAGHRVAFNRAVAASQSFGKQFEDLDKQLSKQKNLAIEDWPERPRKWLEHGLLDRILGFVDRAKDDTWALDVAIYEYELPAIVAAVNAAHKRKVDLRVLYHAKVGDDQTQANEESLKKIPKAKKRARITSGIFHDKFIVLSKVSAAGKRIPKAVLCGSTNFTENGVYRQANVVHSVDDATIAKKYAEVFDFIWDNAEDVTATRDWINQNNPISSSEAIFAGFSPRSGEVDLAEFIRVIKAADRDLLFATAFALPDKILDALLGQANDSVLRFGLQNTASRISGYHGDRTAQFVATALLSKGLEGWVKEGLRGQRGNLLVHTKAVVVNFTGDKPMIISGSHNLSGAASKKNDENYLIIRGDTDLADRHGLEILRFYDHYRFRYYAKLLKFQKAKPLAVDDSWADLYYTPGRLKCSDRLRFSGR